MKEKKFKLYIYAIAIATLGLLLVQIFWINNVLLLENERFDRNVKEAINKTKNDIEKLETSKHVFNVMGNNCLPQVVVLKDKSNNKKIDKDKFIQGKIINHKGKKKKDQSGFKFEFRTSSQNDSMFTNIEIVNNNIVTTKTNVVLQLDSLRQNKSKIINEVFENMIYISLADKFEERVSYEIMDSLLTVNLTNNGIDENYNFAVIENRKDSVIYGKTYYNKQYIKDTKYKLEILPNQLLQEKYILYVKFNNTWFSFIKKITALLLISVLLIGVIIYVFYKTLKSYLMQKRVNQIKTDLINNVTHEFKTPISSITLACEALQANILNDEKKLKRTKYLNIISEENKRLKIMVDNLLTTAKLENGEINISISSVNLVGLINDVVDKYKMTIEKAECEISVNFKTDKLYYDTDSYHLNCIISNLIDNAIKYNERKPEINITVTETSPVINILIEDNGIGIDKKYFDKIFDTFFRVPTGNIYKGKGYGIGLSYVKKAVQSLGGYVIVSSEINVGSKFTIFLPK
ncbi:MAG: HAMP domain-containing sensor histidine kinase [bacterium]